MADNDLDPLWQDLDWYVTYNRLSVRFHRSDGE